MRRAARSGLALMLALTGLATGALAQRLPGEKPGPVPPPIIQVAPPAAAGFMLIAISPALRGQTRPEAGSPTGGVAYHDAAGWYRFTMANGGTVEGTGELRLFRFPSGGQQLVCSAVAKPLDAFAAFSMEQLQAELDTLYAQFDLSVAAEGRSILKRETISLTANNDPAPRPVRALGWDVQESNGLVLTYAMIPLPSGLLTVACGGSEPGHHREVIERYLRIGSGVQN